MDQRLFWPDLEGPEPEAIGAIVRALDGEPIETMLGFMCAQYSVGKGIGTKIMPYIKELQRLNYKPRPCVEEALAGRNFQVVRAPSHHQFP